MEAATERKTEAAGRAVIYGLLARLFAEELGEEELTWLQSGADGVLDMLVDLGIDAEAVARLSSAGSRTPETAALDLAVEYAGLFEAHNKVYPFASCWIPNAKPRLLGPRAAQAQAFYAEVGLGLGEHDAFRADHVGVELGFLSVLAGRIAAATTDDAIAEEQDRYDRFLASCALPWMPEFFAAVVKNDRSDFYAAAARISAAFLTLDAEMRGVQVQ